MYHKKIHIIVLSLLISSSLCLYGISRKRRKKAEAMGKISLIDEAEVSVKIEEEESHDRYKVRTFIILMDEKKRLSEKQIDEHKKLYAGYVAKRNEIDEQLKVVDKTKSNQSYSSFRALKVSETFSRNGSILHELYFENIAAGKKVGTITEKIINKNFGSWETYKNDLMATALSARGWAITCYNIDDGRIQNYLFDSHNQMVPVMTIPLVVIDTYEHAYAIDYGINRQEYLAVLWSNINWDVVEERIKKWVDWEM